MKFKEIKVDSIFGVDGVHNPNEVNPYVGCMFSCVYCYVPENPNTKGDIQIKVNAPDLVAREIKSLDPDVAIFLSSLTDPYLYAERRYEITRNCIKEVIKEPGYRLSILTKSDLVTRDIDLLQQLESVVQFSLGIIDERVQKVIEPFAPSTQRRLRGIEILENSGIQTSVRIKPILPFDLSDVRKTVERLCNITSGQIVVQGVGMRRPFVLRIAEIAKVYFPEKMVRWLYDLDATKERQIELVEYLKSHLRVDYKEIDDVIEEVEDRFVKK